MHELQLDWTWGPFKKVIHLEIRSFGPKCRSMPKPVPGTLLDCPAS